MMAMKQEKLSCTIVNKFEKRHMIKAFVKNQDHWQKSERSKSNHTTGESIRTSNSRQLDHF